jgi:resuscitation-promoting factor RpfA
VRRGVVVLAALVAVPLVGVTAAGADPSQQQWATLRACESSGRYGVVATHGHYGAYQFDLPTWRSVGGVGLPSQASPAEQDYRALYLYRMRGWQPWECAGMRNLTPDPDAATKRVPTRAESAYMAPGAPPPRPPAVRASSPAAGSAPPWPGVVYAFGDCAPALRQWQLRMNTRGYDFQGTGCYREETRRAVLDLQRERGITPSGRLGPLTWRAAWSAQ